MLFKAGDILDVKGSPGYIDFCGKIEIITITTFDKATDYQEDFLDWWFEEEDDYYKECQNENNNIYIGRFLEGNHLANVGKSTSFFRGVPQHKRNKENLSLIVNPGRGK